MERLKDKEGIELLVEAIKKLDLVPRTGFGKSKIKFQFQNGELIFTEDSFVVKNTTKVNVKIQ
jgi:hypothetical protein